MRSIKLLFFIYLIIFSSQVFGQSEPKGWIIRKMEIHSPSSIQLLRAYDNLPYDLEIVSGGSTISTTKSTPAFFYLETGSYQDALTSMATNVHEIGHAYGSKIPFDYLMNCACEMEIDFDDIQQGFYLSGQEKFWIQIDNDFIFPSAELSNTIPDELRTFRFDTYIEGNSSTQQHGIVGLLDEMNAYYLGAKFNFDMLPVYKELFPSDYLNKWVQHSASEMTAFFEFDFFIKEYLLYAKKYNPSTYHYLKEQSEFPESYKKIHSKFSQLTRQYESKVTHEKASMELYYDTPFWQDDYFRLRDRLNSGIYNGITADFLY